MSSPLVVLPDRGPCLTQDSCLAQVAVAMKQSKAAAAQDAPAEQDFHDLREDGQAAPPVAAEATPVLSDSPAAGAKPAPAVPVS